MNEFEAQLKTQKDQAHLLVNELNILNSIFEQEPDIHIGYNNFSTPFDKENIPFNNLTKEEIIRNYLTIIIGLVTLCILFQRADFLTFAFTCALYGFFYKKWKNSDFLNFGVGLVVLLIYDCIW